MQNRLMQLVRDNARAAKPSIRAQSAADGSAAIYLYDVIDPTFGVSASDFNRELALLKGTPVALHINSPGGDVFDGRAMATAIKEHGDVTAYIDGLAASAATYVAIAAKSVQIAEGAFFMIHNAWTVAFGNKNDLVDTADLLDKIDASLVNDYAKKTGLPVAEIVAMMDAETWMTADEAKAMNFVDAIVEPAPVSACWNLSAYHRAPPALQALPADELDDALPMQRNRNRLRLYEFG